jgi:mannose-6-phosphate isomerase
MAVLSLSPVYQERIWGGQSFREFYGRDLPAGKKIGEAWEVCDRPEAQSQADGRTLHELWTGPRKKEIFGTKAPGTERFPILIKLLDARDRLSLQVHPPAALAPKFNGEPKTELWYFLHTRPEAGIYVGLRKGVTRKAFEAAIETRTLADCFHRLPTAPGEAMFLPSGRVHAIGAGNVILEIQQNSDTTFRVYDWDRTGDDGKPRQLHVEQSLECINFNDFEPVFTQPHGSKIIRCNLFNIDRTCLFEKEEREFAADPATCAYVFVAHGRVKIGETGYPAGSSLLIEACSGTLPVAGLDDYVELVSVTFPV